MKVSYATARTRCFAALSVAFLTALPASAKSWASEIGQRHAETNRVPLLAALSAERAAPTVAATNAVSPTPPAARDVAAAATAKTAVTNTVSESTATNAVSAKARKAALAKKSAPAKKPAKAKRPAKVTSASTYYDRKEGIAVLTGRVHVDDEEYQMYADKAFLFMSATNDLSRLVAVGHVALTNGTKRAYGGKASYYRDTGLVILYAADGAVAEVREEKPDGDQIVRGRKIKFWTGSEQVEVLEAEITAPTQNVGGLSDIKRGL